MLMLWVLDSAPSECIEAGNIMQTHTHTHTLPRHLSDTILELKENRTSLSRGGGGGRLCFLTAVSSDWIPVVTGKLHLSGRCCESAEGI